MTAIKLSPKDPQVIRCAFARTAGLSNPEKHFSPEVLEAADGLTGYSLGEAILAAAKEAGYSERDSIKHSNISEVLRAAFSTHTLTTLLTSTGNKILLEGFNAVSQPWREVAAIRPVKDFKTWTLYRMTGDMEYEEVGPAGEIHHGTVGQESYTLQAKTYALLFSLTRQDIINDDLGAFDDLRKRLGMGAAIALNKRFWTLWLATKNAGTFWTEARGNLITGASLGETGLNSAVAAFRDMAATAGNIVSLEPDRVLVPAELEATARKLYVSMELRDTTTGTNYPTYNSVYNRFRPIIVPELGNELYPGYSATGWWLLANPAVLPSAVVGFLSGVESPTIETSDADFNTLGIQFRGYHDFAVSMAEWRASVAAEAGE